MTKFTIDVKFDLEKDAQNYRSAFNKNTHSAQRKDQIAKILDFDFTTLIWIKEKETFSLMKDYLEKTREIHKEITDVKIKTIEEEINNVKDKIFSKMITLTKHPIYRDNFTIYLTSLNRWPYNYQEWYTLTSIFWKNHITPFIHELLHFQTIHYYKEYIISKLHDEKKFEDLKEALTFLLNHEFKDSIDGYDMWYPQHAELREKLEEYRVHSDKDFDKLIDYWCDLLS